LAQQIQKVVMALGDYMGAQCHACIGGTSVREDMRKLDDGVHVVVGTSNFLFVFHLYNFLCFFSYQVEATDLKSTFLFER
jgi:hypothetical protein